MDWIATASPRSLARFAGALYVVNILLGAFSIGIVPSILVVAGDAAATAHNIDAHQVLYRLSLAADVIVGLTNVPLALIFWELFKIVNRRLALLVVLFTAIATAIEVSYRIDQFATPALLSGGPYTTGFSAEQAQALAYAPVALGATSYNVSSAYYAFYAISIGYLIVRSSFLPGVIGVLMAFDGIAYLLFSFADMIAPRFATHLVPWIQLPVLTGEGSFCVWMLVSGVDPRRWNERAAAAQRPAMEVA